MKFQWLEPTLYYSQKALRHCQTHFLSAVLPYQRSVSSCYLLHRRLYFLNHQIKRPWCMIHFGKPISKSLNWQKYNAKKKVICRFTDVLNRVRIRKHTDIALLGTRQTSKSSENYPQETTPYICIQWWCWSQWCWWLANFLHEFTSLLLTTLRD